jgi:hypothetical protein
MFAAFNVLADSCIGLLPMPDLTVVVAYVALAGTALDFDF